MVERAAGRMPPDFASASVEALAKGRLCAASYRPESALASATARRRDTALEIMRLEQAGMNLDMEISALRRIMRKMVS